MNKILSVLALGLALGLGACAKPEDTIAKRCEKILNDATEKDCECLAKELADGASDKELRDIAKAFAKAKDDEELREELSQGEQQELLAASKKCSAQRSGATGVPRGF